MLLRVGLAMMLFAVSLGVAVAVVLGLRSETPAEPTASVEPRSSETRAQENEVELGEFDLGEKLEIDDESQMKQDESQMKQDESQMKQDESHREQPGSSQERPEFPPASNADWPGPRADELERLEEPRYFEPASNAMMTLTIEDLGLYGVPVINSDSPQALNMGVVHVPGTSFPWDEGAQRNVYIAGHRYGYLGTNSRLVFFNLNELRRGNEIIFEDRGGRVYKYQVDEVFETGPNDYWVMDQVLGRDLLTLQTCTPIPTFEKRLIVRADRA